MKRHSIGVAILVAANCLARPLPADDWPQWRGPQRNGISNEQGLLQEWPAEGPKLLWQVKDAGFGYSTPAVVGNRIYLLGNDGPDNEFVQARDVDQGQLIWSVTLGKVGPNIPDANYPGARSTPTVDGDVLYALGSDGDLACLDRAGGTIRWKKSLRHDFAGVPGKWAYAESPLVDGDMLVCTPGGKDAVMVALHKTTGDVIWKAALPEEEPAAYSSIAIVEASGIKQYVTFLDTGLVGVEAGSGKVLWRYGKTAEGSPANIPTPYVRGDYVYSATGRGGGGLIQLKAGPQGGIQPVEIYAAAKLPTSIGGVVIVGDFLYGTGGQGLMCVDFATGEVKWQERQVPAGSILLADNRLYVHAEREGDVFLVEPDPQACRVRGRLTPPSQPTERGQPPGRAWAYPVVASGRLYIRDLECLWCYDVAEVKADQ